MSPELIQDSGYNENADVWSLGCIIYELCELNSPFRNKKEKMSLMDLFENITKCNYKPISSRYSQDLSQAIKNMIVVDPSKRWSSEQVYRLASKMLEGASQPKLDPIITMDDIYVKLALLNYVEYFCKPAERKPINRFYFAIQDPQSNQNDQIFYFL
jgi:serine/threonine protein kinase